MPARRRVYTRPKARPHKVKAGNAWVNVAVILTRAEIQKLKDGAASDFRAVAAYATWLVAQHLDGPIRRQAGSVPGAGPGDRRIRLRITLVMPVEMRDQLLARGEAEMRSRIGSTASVSALGPRSGIMASSLGGPVGGVISRCSCAAGAPLAPCGTRRRAQAARLLRCFFRRGRGSREISSRIPVA
jgi:hypothetical protein